MAIADFTPFERKMRAAGLPPAFIDTFHYYYDHLVGGATGFIGGDEARPVDALPDYDELDETMRRAGHDALDRAIVLKLNGGLGTSMGMQRAKVAVGRQGRTVVSGHHRAPAAPPAPRDRRAPAARAHEQLQHARRFAGGAGGLCGVHRRMCRSTFSSTRSPRSGRSRSNRRHGRTTRRRSGARPATAISTRRW